MSGDKTTTPVVFLGPTMTSAEAEELVEAIYLPPASQGSIVQAVRRYNPSAVLLIDGTFQAEPAVRHKEILWAMARGVTMIGAASMGALRAAELAPYGMLGVGLIFRWYRRFKLLPDDAVAVLHGPQELGARALTHALVDLRMTFRGAQRAGLIDRPLREKLAAAARSLGFRERTLARVAKVVLDDDLPEAATLTARLQGCFVDQKRKDARQALQFLANGPLRPPSPSVRPKTFVTTTAFLRDLRHAGIDTD